jgi:mono/diheme cytochrome c family protein
MTLARLVAVATAVCTVTACDVPPFSWFTTFQNQPRIEPWEAEYTMHDSAGKIVVDETVPFRGNPQMSVPITGIAVAGFVVSYRPAVPTIDSMASLANPHAPTTASLDNGRKYYQINCAVCHGAGGGGNGPAARYGIPALPLTAPHAVGLTDGYIFGVIRNGRGAMPTYDRIEDEERWDVVNYIRSLQGKFGTPADTSPAGYPGQNGRMVPGFTRTAPTRPVPYRVEGPGGLNEFETPKPGEPAHDSTATGHHGGGGE